MKTYKNAVDVKKTPQTEKVFGKDQVKNSAGGYVFAVDNWTRLDRFLVLGSEGGTYYVGERKLTQDNAKAVLACIKEDGQRAVRQIALISQEGRAPKNTPAIFALALAASFGNDETKAAAFATMPSVCRTGTHLFEFASACDALRGWGRGLRNCIANWYNSKDGNDLAYQVTKYQQREGWSHSDLLRLSHAKPSTEDHQAIFRYIRYGIDAMGPLTISRKLKDETRQTTYGGVDATLPRFIQGAEAAKKAKSADEIVRLIREFNLVRELIPTQFLNSVEVWEALLEKMPLNALVRNLGKMTSIGLIKPLSSASRKVVEALSNEEYIKKSRLHPLNLLVALKIYEQGKGDKGSLAWSPNRNVTDALDGAFYKAFKAVEPTGKRWLLALDVSGSMGWGNLAGMTGITPRVGSAAMSLVTAATEPVHHIVGFSSHLVPVNISPRMRLDAAIAAIERIPMGSTDCAQPMIYAKENKLDVDTFVVYTDNETWAGQIHPFQALKDYRQARGIPAKLIVVGMTATEFSIADKDDAGMMDVVGFDTSAPAVMADFTRN
jgi:60 kDa SS-A/Ro ribonucleoprotein